MILNTNDLFLIKECMSVVDVTSKCTFSLNDRYGHCVKKFLKIQHLKYIFSVWIIILFYNIPSLYLYIK